MNPNAHRSKLLPPTKYPGHEGDSPLRFWAACMAVALFCFLGAANAAQITMVRGAKGDMDTIKIQGEIKYGDDDQFRALALGSQRAIVLLESDGGRLAPALEIGKIIRIKGFATAVQEASCTSSCALAWLAGEPRYMNNFTSIGFHTAFSMGKSGQRTSNPTHGAIIGAYLTRLGFSEKVVMFVVSASAQEMHWLQKSTADRLCIAVNVQPPPGPTSAMGNFEEALKARAAAPPDDARAAVLYSKSAVAGFAGAQNNLGDLYELGRGVPQNDKLAVYWYTRAAERGEPTAYLSLASLLAEESTDPEALVEAAKYAALAFTLLGEGRNKDKAARLTESLGRKLGLAEKERVIERVKAWVPLYQEELLMGDKPKR